MAFNWQTFRIRTITTILFAVVMLAGLLWNQWSFFILFSIIHFGCWVEYQKLVELIDKGYREITLFHKYGVMLAGWCLMLWFTGDTYTLFGVRLHELGLWTGLILIFLLSVAELLFTKHIWLKNIAHSVLGLLYISLSWGLMMDLYKETGIRIHDSVYLVPAYFIPIVVIASIWLNDTLAYLVGSIIGKNSLSRISPKKTWEGTIGGIVLSTALVGLGSYYGFHLGLLTYHVITIAGLSAIIGTFGDLLESKFKRMANVKDTGTLLPGHGGFLDRFDSLLIATPFVWVYVQLFMK